MKTMLYRRFPAPPCVQGGRFFSKTFPTLQKPSRRKSLQYQMERMVGMVWRVPAHVRTRVRVLCDVRFFFLCVCAE